MSILAQSWWILVLRGVLAVIFGVLASMWPGITIASFVLLFGAYALIDGVSSLVAALKPPAGESRVWLIIGGILGVLAAIVVFMMPGLSALFLFYLVAAWAIATGISQILAAIQLRKVIEGEWLLALSGALSIALGFFMVARPAAGLLGLIWVISMYAIVIGITLIILGFRLRSWWKGHEKAPEFAHAGQRV
jgi:uncharacterized membrane protein HdeD (DUF308 family)